MHRGDERPLLPPISKAKKSKIMGIQEVGVSFSALAARRGSGMR